MRTGLIFILLIIMIAVSGASYAGWHAWHYSMDGLQSRSVLAYSGLVSAPHTADLDGDGSPENFFLTRGSVVIQSGGLSVWSSPGDWQVRAASLADLNRDHQAELALLVWRPFQPWPVDRVMPYGGRINTFHNAEGYSCHLILVGWQRSAYRQLWTGSALAQPLRAFIAADLDGDGWQELAALESNYGAQPADPASTLTVWSWNGFGFDLRDRQPGDFRSLQLGALADGSLLLMVKEE